MAKIRAWLRIIAAAGLCGVTGCYSLEKAAPPVTPQIVELGAARGSDVATLERGRIVYTTGGCIQCHVPEPVDRYPLPDWEEIIPEMAKRAKIKSPQECDLRGYVWATHEAMARGLIVPSKK